MYEWLVPHKKFLPNKALSQMVTVDNFTGIKKNFEIQTGHCPDESFLA